jgi:hypothetical protein
VAGGQRIFINTGLIMRTETPNQLIGVMAHESGHIAGGHLVRMQEEMRNLSTLQILEAILGAGAMAGGAVSGSGMGWWRADHRRRRWAEQRCRSCTTPRRRRVPMSGGDELQRTASRPRAVDFCDPAARSACRSPAHPA